MKLYCQDSRQLRLRPPKLTIWLKIRLCRLMFPQCFRTSQILFFLSWLYSPKVWTTLSITNLRNIITIIIINIAIFKVLKMKIKRMLLQTNHYKIQSQKDAQHANKRKKYWQRLTMINLTNSRTKVTYIWSPRLKPRPCSRKRPCCKSLIRLVRPLAAWWKPRGRRWSESWTTLFTIRCVNSSIRHSSWDSSGKHSS